MDLVGPGGASCGLGMRSLGGGLPWLDWASSCWVWLWGWLAMGKKVPSGIDGEGAGRMVCVECGGVRSVGHVEGIGA